MNISTFSLEFHLSPFFSSAKKQLALFIGVLFMYLVTLLGNFIIIALVCLVSQLHTPMYFFLCNLSIQDTVYVSSILPNLLANTITGDTTISFSGCITQIFTFATCINTEFFLLTSMSYDRYVAICMPLRYTLIINKKVCALLAITSWCSGALNSMTFCLLASNLLFCNKERINHFFCDAPSLLKLAYSDLTHMKIFITVDGIVLGWVPFMLIITSYIYIISTILRIQTSTGRSKTFSSCSSHLMVVILFYVTCLSLNMKSDHSQDIDKLLSMFYIAVVPVLNPLVYSLRNRDVLIAMKKVFIVSQKRSQIFQ